ncbi:uncharacterized protein DNG_02553 [Cephalotrichum gorgonifer]|uniref:Uncharacterized protein n=1 Tax=Cephalotrichum gorgonifer TaxID=2041049 RepID=A0AAE8MTS1_9PEZI|nr:uncharacterized protein DNG_02553 [Cephalotrichum gorgonifer]
MAETAIALGLFCPEESTLYVCSDSAVPFVGCCTTDPCKDGSGICPDDNLVPASFELDVLFDNVSPQECLGGEWYACPDLDTPFAGCCSEDACQDRCPADSLRAAVITDYQAKVFNMANAMSAGRVKLTPTKTTFSRVDAAITPEARSTSSTTKPSATPASTAPHPVPSPTRPSPPEKTILVPDNSGKLSEKEIVALACGVGVVSFIIICCIVYKIVNYNRKRRPGYPYRTDHDPNWRPPSSTIELDSDIAPADRQCGTSRAPGNATRPRSYEDATNYDAEARLTGIPGPRRARSAEPCRTFSEILQSHERRVPHERPVVHGQPSAHSHGFEMTAEPIETERVYGNQYRPQQRVVAPRANNQAGQNGWVNAREHAEYYHAAYHANGDYVIDMEGRGQSHYGHRASDSLAQALAVYSADELRRHTTYEIPAARSDDALGRFASYPSPDTFQPPAPRSEGAGQVLNWNQHAHGRYVPYILPARDSMTGQPESSGMNVPVSPGKAHVVEDEPVGELSDPRARSRLGQLYVLNPDKEAESDDAGVGGTKANQDLSSGGKDKGVMVMIPANNKSSGRNGAEGDLVTKGDEKGPSEDVEKIELNKEQNRKGMSTKSEASGGPSKINGPEFLSNTFQAAEILTMVSPEYGNEHEKKTVEQSDCQEAPAPTSSTPAASYSQEPQHLAATGVLPPLRPENDRRDPSTVSDIADSQRLEGVGDIDGQGSRRPTAMCPNCSADMGSADTQQPEVGYRPVGTHPESRPENCRPASSGPATTARLVSQRPGANDVLPLRHPRGRLPASSTAPLAAASHQYQQQASSVLPVLRPENAPRVAARRPSELHMDVPAAEDLGYPIRPPAQPEVIRGPDGSIVTPLDRRRQYQDRYDLVPRRADRREEQQDGQYQPQSGRYGPQSQYQPQAGQFQPQYAAHPAPESRPQQNLNNAHQESTQPYAGPNHNRLRQESRPVGGLTRNIRRQHGSQPAHHPHTPQGYVHAYNTRVYYPNRANPPRPLVRPPPNTVERPRRSAQQLGLGPQPQPGYRTYEGGRDLNRGNDIAHWDPVPPPPAYHQGGHLNSAAPRQYVASGVGGARPVVNGVHGRAVAVPRSEYPARREDENRRGQVNGNYRPFDGGEGL